MRTKKPDRVQTELKIGYEDEMDRWILSHQMTFEQSDVNRGVCRLYAIFVNECTNKFYI